MIKSFFRKWALLSRVSLPYHLFWLGFSAFFAGWDLLGLIRYASEQNYVMVALSSVFTLVMLGLAVLWARWTLALYKRMMIVAYNIGKTGHAEL